MTLEDHQAEFQVSMVEFEGKVFNKDVLILINLRVRLSFISHKVLEIYQSQTKKF